MLRFAIVFSIISLIVTGSTYFILRKRLKASGKAKSLLLAAHLLGGILMIAGPIQYRLYQAAPSHPLTLTTQFLQYYLMGWIGVNLITFGVAEILNFLFKTFDPSKRIFLTEGVARGILTVTTLSTVGGLIQLKTGPKVERVTIKLPTLPSAFEGMTIAQLSDVHIGPLAHRSFAQKLVDQTLELKPDLIALTGDFVDGSLDQLREFVEPFRNFKAPLGTYFVTGNHEYYSGPEDWLNHFESFGIHAFRNNNILLEKTDTTGEKQKLMLAGVYDVQGERYSEKHKTDPHLAAKTSEEVSCKILLAHNPKSMDEAKNAGFHLQLSGHTHAGQFYPFTFIARLAHTYFEGLYQVNENTQIYVNRGTGFWGPPNRLGKTGEITLITLTKG